MKPLWLTQYDRAFEPIYERHFLPSFHSTGLARGFELSAAKISNEHFGAYGERNYLKSYRRKLEHVRDEVVANPGRLVVWSDADIRFYRPMGDIIKSLASSHDLGCLADSAMKVENGVVKEGVCCTGLQFYVATPKIRGFLNEWLGRGRERDPGWRGWQEPFNETIRARGSNLKVAVLDSRFWTVGLVPPGRIWDQSQPIPPAPKDLFLHHANYTIGVENKLILLDWVLIQNQIEW